MANTVSLSEPSSSAMDLSAAKRQTPAGGSRWFNWIMGGNENKDDGAQQEDHKTGYIEDAGPTTADWTTFGDDDEPATEKLLYPRDTAVMDNVTADVPCAGHNIANPTTLYVGGQITQLSRDQWRQQYVFMNGDFKPLRNLEAEAQWMVNNGWPDCSQDFDTESRNIVVSQDICTGTNQKRLARDRVNILYPETDSGTTLADDIATMPDRTRKYTDLEKTLINVITELKKDTFNMANELEFMKKRHHKTEQIMIKNTNMANVQNQHAKHDSVVEQFDDGTHKSMKTSTNRYDPDEWRWKKEDDMFLKKELWMLRDNYYSMEQTIKTMDAQYFKMEKIMDKLQECTGEVSTTSTKNNFESETVYMEMNNRMDKLEKIVDGLKSEKQSLVRANRKMAKEISRHKRKHSENKKVFSKFRSQTKKDLDDVKQLFHSKETIKDINNTKTEIIVRHKYDKLKMRLSMIEKADMTNQIKAQQQMLQNMMIMSNSYSRGGGNESMQNVHDNAKGQQAYSPYLEPPNIPTGAPPPPPLPQPGSSAQHLRYVINSDILKDMAKQLRKPGDQIRKIPKRLDMNIPEKVTKSAEQEIPLPPPAPPLPLIAPESPIESTALPELPSTSVDVP